MAGRFDVPGAAAGAEAVAVVAAVLVAAVAADHLGLVVGTLAERVQRNRSRSRWACYRPSIHSAVVRGSVRKVVAVAARAHSYAGHGDHTGTVGTETGVEAGFCTAHFPEALPAGFVKTSNYLPYFSVRLPPGSGQAVGQLSVRQCPSVRQRS